MSSSTKEQENEEIVVEENKEEETEKISYFSISISQIREEKNSEEEEEDTKVEAKDKYYGIKYKTTCTSSLYNLDENVFVPL